MACTIDRSRPVLTWACQTKVWSPAYQFIRAMSCTTQRPIRLSAQLIRCIRQQLIRLSA